MKSKTVTLKILICFFSLLLSQAAPADVSDYETQRLLNARSTDEIMRVATETTKLKSARAACEIQQKLETIPTFCVRAAQLEVKLGLIASNSAVKLISNLSASCARRARTVAHLEPISSALKMGELPVLCRKALLARHAELIYMNTPSP